MRALTSVFVATLPMFAMTALLGSSAAAPSAASASASTSASSDAGAPHVDAARDSKAIPPDPVPLASESFFVLTLHWEKQNVTLEKAKRLVTKAKTTVPRTFGRFAVELFVGPTLIERVRFDFPLIADDSKIGDAFIKGLSVSIDVKVPESDRPTRMEVWDRATDRRWTLPYPPKVTP